MKTSKKLLSLFLALVMVITSCSVGFTAFAADGNKTDANNAYWNDEADAQAAFAALNSIADTYVPKLLNIPAVKNILEGTLGMEVKSDTGISEVVAGASPFIMGLLGGAVDKSAIIGEGKLNEYYYSYLEGDGKQTISFYTLYDFCQKNQGAEGELGDYARETLPKLQKLLDQYSDALNAYGAEMSEAEAALGDFMPYLPENEETLQGMTKSQLRNLPAGEKKLSELAPGKAQTYIDYLNDIFKSYNSPEKAENVADVFYYTMTNEGGARFFSARFVGTALLGGAEIKPAGASKAVDLSNYAEVMGAVYSLEQFCTDSEIDYASLSDDEKAIVQEHYDSALIMMLLQAVLPEMNTSLSASSPYYEEMCIGLMVYTGAFGSLEECQKNVNDAKITDEQITKFWKHLTNSPDDPDEPGLGLTGYDKDKIVEYLNSDSPFSPQATKYFLGYITDSSSSNMIGEFFIGNEAEGTKGFLEDKGVANTFVLKDNDYNTAYIFKNGKDGKELALFDRLNVMMASELLIDKFGDDLRQKGDASNLRDVAEPALYTEDFFNFNERIQPHITEKYDYNNYKIKDELMVGVVNSTLNSLLGQYLDPETQIGGIINSVLEGLLETPIELYNDKGTGVLNDIWFKLYDDPISEIFNLLPTLTIVLDELLVPILLNTEGDKYNGFLYDLLCTGDGILAQYTQEAGNTNIGLGTLNIDLNKALPSILNWLVGNQEKAVEIVGTYSADGGYDSNVPKFLNIYVADKALYGAHLDGGLAKVLKNIETFSGDNAYLADSIDEAVTYIANFALDAINTYLENNADDHRYDSEGTVTQSGLNNVFVALPQIIDELGKKFIKEYEIKGDDGTALSDWTYTYGNKIAIVDKAVKNDAFDSVKQKQNTVLQGFKDYATKDDPAGVLGAFVDILIGNWMNSALDLINDTIKDDTNKITSKLPLVQGLLYDALGGFDKKSVITDVFNGLFQLKRSDAASFTFSKQDATGYVGFSNTSGFFLLSNLQFKKGDEVHGLIPVILTIINPNDSTKADYKTDRVFKATSPKLASSSKVKKSAAGTDYSKLLTKKNLKAAQKLVDVLDTLLSSLLENTSLNGFDLDSTDNIMASVVSFASGYLGYQNTNDIVKLVNNYLYYIAGESSTLKSVSGRVGTRPTKNGDVNKKKVYTPANLSNLVIQTYSLVENIVDYLFYNQETGLLNKSDPNMLLADAVYGIISPDAVGIRLSDDYKATADVLFDKDHHNWNSFKVEITDANAKDGNYQKNYLKFDFAKGNKKAFYNGLGESLGGIAAILGVLLTKSVQSEATPEKNYYSTLVYPLFKTMADATGASGVMSPADFAKASAPQQLIQGIITPVASVLDQIYDAPASFLLNLVKGVAGIINDDSIKGYITNAILPVVNLANGAATVVGYLSPTLSAKLVELIGSLTSGLSADALGKNIIVNLINNITIGSKQLRDYIELPNINWKRLNAAKSPAEVLLLIYAYLVDTVLGSDLISGIVNSFAPGLTDILKKLDATQLLTIISDVIASVQSPTEIYWTFREYAGKITNTFVYPQGILASDATKAVDQLDDIVANVFPLLNGLGVTDIEGLNALVNDKLYTNALLTTAAKGIYGALSKGTVGEVFKTIGIDVSTKGFADYLTDKSYGKTYSSAAAKLRKTKSWDKIDSLNWGFTDGSSKAQTGFINGLAAVLRPLNDVLAVFLAEGSLKGVVDLDVVKIAKLISAQGKTKLGEGEYGVTLDYKFSKGIFTLGVRSNVKTASGGPNVRNELKIDVEAIAKDLQKLLDGSKGISLGTNGYESAVIPLLEAFMCDGVKTYKQYLKDYNKAKDNLLVNVLKPVFGLVDDITTTPFDTVTKILPNVAYFIESNGVAQLVGNLLAPLTGKDGILGVLKKDGLDLDKLIKLIFAKDLGKIVADALDLDVKLKIKLTDMSQTNVQVIVVPLVNKILQKNNLPLTLPDFSFKTLASHGTIQVVKSAARNSEGKFTTRQVKSRQGETLVAVLRYVSNLLIKNASGLKKIICGIDAVKKNDTIKNIVGCVFTQIGLAHQDDIVRAVFYLLTEQATDKFFDYSNFKYDDSYKFSFGDMDEEFCRKLNPMLDGMIGSLLEGGLAGLVSEKLYTDNLVAKLATGLYGAIEGVNINDNIGSLTDLLAMTDIDFSTGNVASLLVNGDYGRTYPDAAAVIRSAGSWKNVNADSLKFGVKDRDSFLNALVSVLRPLYGVLDVLLNDAALNIFDLVKIPGSDAYSSTIVPLLEAFGVYNIRTQYQYREDIYKAYDNILLDIINPLWDKVEDILNAPLETLMSILPNLSLFFANDGLLQIVDNLLTPVSALLEAVKPIVNVNDILKAVGLDIPKLLKDKVGLTLTKFDIYDLPGTLKPLVGADNFVNTINSILGIIKIKGNPLGLVLPDIDWFQLASHGKFVLNGTSQAATYGKRIYVVADEDETLIALLRFLINTINYKDNYNQIVNLITGLLGDNVDESLAGTINDVLGMLKGDADQVIADLVELLQQIAG